MTTPGDTMVDLLRYRASTDPDRVIHLFSPDGDSWPVTLTYAQLDARARALAVALRADAAPGDRALLLYPPGLEFTVGFWGCLYAGLVAVPVAPPSPRSLEASLARLSAIAGNCSATLLLTTAEFTDQLRPLGAALGSPARPLTVRATDIVTPERANAWTAPPVDAASVAYLQYSSGSTGLPKGITLPHAAVLANAALIGRAAELHTFTSGVCWLPTFHDMGLLSAVILPVVHDFTVHQIPPTTFVKRPLAWLRALSETQGGLSVAPTFAYELCVRRVDREEAAQLDLTHWRVALCGAEPIRPDVLRRFAERFAVSGFRERSFFPCYGLAEATLMVSGGPVGTGVTTLRVDAAALGRGAARPADAGVPGRELVASGRRHAELPLVVVDPQTLEPLPDGMVGELLVRGRSIARSYWNQPAESAETFDVEVPGVGAGFLRTGDLGFVRDDVVYVTGRRKDLVIIDGTNHYPHDIEAAAGAASAAVRDGAVAAFQTLLPGEPARLVVVAEVESGARLVDAPGEAADGVVAGEVRRAVRTAVHRSTGAPVDDVVLVRRGTIPLTTSGKLQRHAVAELYRTRALEALLAPVVSGGG